jgi:hypothetical protein
MSPIVVALRRGAGRGALVFGSESAVASCYAELSSLTVVTDISGEKARIMCSSSGRGMKASSIARRSRSFVAGAFGSFVVPIVRRMPRITARTTSTSVGDGTLANLCA